MLKIKCNIVILNVSLQWNMVVAQFVILFNILELKRSDQKYKNGMEDGSNP